MKSIHEGNVRKNSPRVRNPPNHLKDYIVEQENDILAGYTVYNCHKVCEIPSTYLEAIQSPVSQLWQRAMEEEIDALTESETFELTLPEGRSLVASK